MAEQDQPYQPDEKLIEGLRAAGAVISTQEAAQAVKTGEEASADPVVLREQAGRLEKAAAPVKHSPDTPES